MRTFQCHYPTCKQTVQKDRILESVQFWFGYCEKEGGFDTY
jgi:hypothetical protein